MTSQPIFEVVDGGLLTTLQDAGRPDLGALGVPRAGACDPTSLAVANLLAGNRADAPCLELTFAGPDLLAVRSVVIGLAGADLGATIRTSGRRVLPGSTHRLAAGDRVSFPGAVADEQARGARAYLAVAGGFHVDFVLGSASTSLVGAFGGLEGRPLRAGDILAGSDAPARHEPTDGRRWPADLRLPRAGDAVSILAGPAADTTVGRAALDALVATEWLVASASDRRGLRLDGPALDTGLPADGPSHGVPTGAIQVTPSGLPIVLLQDAGPTGGYPVLAVVATAALSIIGQAGPGASIRFRLVKPDEARAAERERRHLLAAGAARLGISDPWDDLSSLAGA